MPELRHAQVAARGGRVAPRPMPRGVHAGRPVGTVLAQTRVPAGDRTGGSRMRSATDVAHDCRDI